MPGMIQRLKGVTISDPTVPTLASFGAMPTSGLKDLFKLKEASLGNSALVGGVISDQGNSTGANKPSWANGILTVPDAEPAGQYNRLLFPGVHDGLARSYAVVMRKVTERGHYLLRPSDGQGVGLFLSSSMTAIFANGATRNIPLGAVPAAGNWFGAVVSVSATGIKAIINSGAISAILFSDYGGAPTGGSSATRFGNTTTSTAQAVQGEFAHLSTHNRALSDDEMRSVAVGIAAFARSKGIVIG